MSEQASNNSTLYFAVGGLLVAVLGIGYFMIVRDGGEGGGAVPAASEIVEDAGTDFKVELGKDGGVSGSIEQDE